jgi:hypothetical protein
MKLAWYRIIVLILQLLTGKTDRILPRTEINCKPEALYLLKQLKKTAATTANIEFWMWLVTKIIELIKTMQEETATEIPTLVGLPDVTLGLAKIVGDQPTQLPPAMESIDGAIAFLQPAPAKTEEPAKTETNQPEQS